MQGRLQDMEDLTTRLQGQLATTTSSAAEASNKLVENAGLSLPLCFFVSLFLVVVFNVFVSMSFSEPAGNFQEGARGEHQVQD